jgi:predicted ATPase/DNA-binding SARP family transcriptional activator
MIVCNEPGVETLSIYTLGGVAIELRHVPITGASTTNPVHQRLQFRTRTVEALLIYLASQRRPLGREILAELLWPERTQEQARTNLRVAIHRLREQLDPYLLVTRQSIAIHPDREIFLDAAHFEAHLATGQLIAATALYRGDFLDGFYQDGSPAFEQWALLERERLRTLAISAYQQLIDQTAAADQVDTAIAAAQRLLSLDSLHEPTHRQLMRLLAQAGQRSAALTQYETCRQLLTTELDVPPDEMTTALYERIRTNSFGPEISDGSTTGSGLSTLPVANDNPESTIHPLKSHNLPHQPTPFIGRDRELAQVESLLANPDCRLLTLLGLGGIGKTRLAIEVAQRIVGSGAAPTNNPEPQPQNPTFADGVCFVSLSSVGTVELVLVTIAQSLGLQTTSSDLHAEIANYLRSRELLLLLDNFEHLLVAADTVAHLLQNAPHVKVLVTSRERLYLREEWLLSIAGLSLVEGLSGEAGQLFMRSAQRVKSDFTGRGEEGAIAAICRQIEGMPLAIELAASWMRVMPCTDIALQIVKNLDFLTTRVRNLPERHRSIRALFDGSWRLLSAIEQGVLRRVSVFAGGWTLEEATAVAGATLALLLDLVDKSLVRAKGQNRFELHELVRQYALEQLAVSGESGLVRQRHYATYLQLFRTADSHLRRPEAATWLARLEPEQDNVRAALQWALDEAHYEDAAWLLVAVNGFWFLHSNWYERGRWLAQLLPHRHQLDADLRLALFIILYAVASSQEEFQSIDRYTGEIMQLLEVCPDKLLRSSIWHFIAAYSSDFSQAAAAWEQSIALGRAASEDPGLGAEFCLWTDREFVLGYQLLAYASCLIEQGKLERATTLSMEGLKLFQTRGNRYGIGDSLGNLGLMALRQGDLAQAYNRLSEVVALAVANNFHAMLCEWQPLLGLVTLYAGKATEARRMLSESLHLCLELKNKFFLARVCAYLAETSLWEGELDQAEQWLGQSLTYYPDPRSITIYEVERLFIAARLASAQQHYYRAATLLGLAEQAHSHIHYMSIGPMRALVDAALATVREALEADVFAEAFAMGQQLSLDEAFTTILAPTTVTGILTKA